MEKKTIVCISCYYKGYDFMDEMKKLGNKLPRGKPRGIGQSHSLSCSPWIFLYSFSFP